MDKVCKIEDCEKKYYARERCKKHYDEDMASGLIVRGETLLINKFLTLLEMARNTSSCVLWEHSLNSNGYGSVAYEGERWMTHRLALFLTLGPPPDDQDYHAAHTPAIGCQRKCMQPAHLRWATSEENQRDRTIDGTACTGEKNPMTKITEPTVRAIRASVADGLTHETTAQKFGVSRSTVTSIIRGITWSHL